MKKQPKSAVIELLDLVWKNSNSATSHSWTRLNGSMHGALSLAIGAGFEFDADDVKYIVENYRSGYWIGVSSEWIYSAAIACDNLSAAKSYEKFRGREPFIADDVTPTRSASTLQKSRLAVGFCFPWKGRKVKVTSFAEDGSYLTACSYQETKGEREKVDKRYKITREDIFAERAERKERAELYRKLTTVADNGSRDKILKSLGIKARNEYDRLPIEKIRKVAKQFCSEATE